MNHIKKQTQPNRFIGSVGSVLCSITNFDTIPKWVHFRAKWVQKFSPYGFTSFENGVKCPKNGFNSI